MLHYKRLYSYTSDENVFFAVTFSLSFVLGFPRPHGDIWSFQQEQEADR